MKKLTNLINSYQRYFISGIVGSVLLGMITSPALAFDQVGLYGMWETRITNSKAYSNPFDFNVIELQAIFTAPSGKQINFFGFYDGDGIGGQAGNVWKLRIMPHELGIWTYTYTWTDGTPGGSGSFKVVDTGLPGPLRVARDRQWYFETSRGEPFHFRGYSMHLWKYFQAAPFNDLVKEYEAAVNTHVAPRGYNVVMIVGPGYVANSGHNWWEGNNFDHFDVRTWENWDRIINIYRTNGIYVFTFSLIAQWDVNNTVGSPDCMERFLRYYVARNSAYWNLFGNSLTWEWPEKWSEDQVTGWMSNILAWNPFRTLLCAHDSSRESFLDWMGFSMRQRQSRTIFGGNGRTLGQHGGVQGSFVKKPIIGSEDVWEYGSGKYGQPRNGTEVRRGAWGIMLAGVMPVYSEWNDASADDAPIGGNGNGEGEVEIQRMFDFFYSKTRYRQYQQLNNLVSRWRRQICSGIPREEYLVYDENGGLINIDLTNASSSATFSVLWFDPKNGNEQGGGKVNGGKIKTLLSPFVGDSVLLLRLLSVS